MSKKVLILIGFMCMGYIGTAQRFASENEWNISTTFGATKLFNTSELNVGDNVNAGLSLEVTRVFDTNFFVSAGTTFSALNSTFLYDNPLNYFSMDLYGGYKIDSEGLTDYSLAIGTSFISAPNTVPNGNSSFSLNFSAGATFWLNHSDYGIIVRNTYKAALGDNFVSHNRFSLGLAYKL